MRINRLLFWPLLALMLALPSAKGQSLQITSQVGASVSVPVPNGGTVATAADGVGRATAAQITLRNAGADPLVLNQISISGISDFTLPGLATLPVTLSAGSSFNFSVQYLPSTANRATATLQIQTAEGIPSASRTYGFQAVGTAPDFGVSYSLGSDSASLPLDSGGRLFFGSVGVQGAITANLTLTNRGSGAGALQYVLAAPFPDFQVFGLPSMPISLSPGASTRFQVLFVPRIAGSTTGTLTLGLGGDRSFTAILEGIGIAADLRISYMLPANQNVLTLSDGGQIAFLPTSMGGASIATVYIENRGGGSGTVNAVSLSGNGFDLVGLPSFPATVDAGKTASFGVRFKPASSGRYTGVLRIELKDRVVTIGVDGSTAPSDFYASYTDARQNSFPLADGGTLSFQATPINATGTATVLIENRGAGTGIVNAVSLTGNGFELAGVPALPLTIEAGKGVSFAVRFRPTSGGRYTGSLKIDLKDRVITVAVDGSTAVPDFFLSYIDPVLNNGVPVSNGGVIPYPDTLTVAKSDILVLLENRGNGGGVVSGITVSGDAGILR
jgi:hypothetical protein